MLAKSWEINRDQMLRDQRECPLRSCGGKGFLCFICAKPFSSLAPEPLVYLDLCKVNAFLHPSACEPPLAPWGEGTWMFPFLPYLSAPGSLFISLF